MLVGVCVWLGDEAALQLSVDDSGSSSLRTMTSAHARLIGYTLVRGGAMQSLLNVPDDVVVTRSS